jgi:hypothetical protein
MNNNKIGRAFSGTSTRKFPSGVSGMTVFAIPSTPFALPRLTIVDSSGHTMENLSITTVGCGLST